MLEKIYSYTTGNEKAVEKLIMDDNVNYIHMVFNKDQGLPEHFSNSNVYMNVIRGRLSLKLDEQEYHEYEKGTLLQISINIKMNVRNMHDETLELIVVKAPAPKNYPKGK
jgi:quercetin dioxygenase-like cupin family protein